MALYKLVFNFNFNYIVTCAVVRVKSWSWPWNKKSRLGLDQKVLVLVLKKIEVLVLVSRPRVLVLVLRPRVLVLVLTKKSYWMTLTFTLTWHSHWMTHKNSTNVGLNMFVYIIQHHPYISPWHNTDQEPAFMANMHILCIAQIHFLNTISYSNATYLCKYIFDQSNGCHWLSSTRWTLQQTDLWAGIRLQHCISDATNCRHLWTIQMALTTKQPDDYTLSLPA